VTEKFDIVAYIRGDGREYVLTHNSGAEELCYTDIVGKTFYQVKNNQYEGFYAADDVIGRTVDTSQGGGLMYMVGDPPGSGAAWCPRFMAVGETFTMATKITHYRKPDGVISNWGDLAHVIKLVAHNPAYLIPTGQKLDAIQMSVSLPGQLPFDTMWFARGHGLIGHQSPDGNQASKLTHYAPAGIKAGYPRETIEWLKMPPITAFGQAVDPDTIHLPDSVRRRAVLAHGKSNIRSTPSTDSEITGTLLNGEIVNVYADERVSGDFTWRKIAAAAAVGWVVSIAPTFSIHFDPVTLTPPIIDPESVIKPALDRITAVLMAIREIEIALKTVQDMLTDLR